MTESHGIAVIIPNLNQGTRLGSVLQSLAQQTISGDRIEVIVVDNGSTDNSAEVAGKYGVTYISHTDERNPYVCRNLGVVQTDATFITFLDSTCVPDRGMLEAFRSCLRKTGADIIAGNLKYTYSSPPTLSEMVDSVTYMRNAEHLAVRQTYPGTGLFMKRSTFLKVGEFRVDLRSGADGEWTGRATRKGMVFAYAENALFYYGGRPFGSLLRKAHRIGWGHGTLAREAGNFSLLAAILDMRPPSPRYLRRVIRTRGEPSFARKSIRLWWGVWVFRVCVQLGKLHVLRRLSD